MKEVRRRSIKRICSELSKPHVGKEVMDQDLKRRGVSPQDFRKQLEQDESDKAETAGPFACLTYLLETYTKSHSDRPQPR